VRGLKEKRGDSVHRLGGGAGGGWEKKSTRAVRGVPISPPDSSRKGLKGATGQSKSQGKRKKGTITEKDLNLRERPDGKRDFFLVTHHREGGGIVSFER